jgi:rubrerythrin
VGMQQYFGSAAEILDFAIAREQEAYEFYTGLAAKVERTEMRGIFRQFAEEERGHKAKLQGVKQGKTLMPAEKAVGDLKIADYVVAEEPTGDMTYQKAIVLAMKKEKAAFKIYTDLAQNAPSAELKQLFEGLAQEEARHKLRFELEYDSVVMGEN